jgi:hypothetical protein
MSKNLQLEKLELEKRKNNYRISVIVVDNGERVKHDMLIDYLPTIEQILKLCED